MRWTKNGKPKEALRRKYNDAQIAAMCKRAALLTQLLRLVIVKRLFVTTTLGFGQLLSRKVLVYKL